MISIKNSVAELERCYEARRVALSCYIEAIRNMSLYAVDLEPEVTEIHRGYLGALADDVASERQKALEESPGTLRGLLRNYRDRGAEYLAALREQLAGTAKALQYVLESLVEKDGDGTSLVKTSLARLREAGRQEPDSALSGVVLSTADALDRGFQDIREQHAFTISQLQTEIRSLQKRIQELETAAAIDELTRLFNRAEMEARIRAVAPGRFSLLLIKAVGFRVTQVHFSAEVVGELAGAFAKRLRAAVPAEAVVGRWSEEEFVAMVPQTKSEALNLARWLSEHLSGKYSCISAGRAVHPSLQLNIAVVDAIEKPPARLLEHINEFLAGR